MNTDPEEPTSQGEPTKPCKECGESKPLSAFPQNPNAPDKRRNACKPCFNAKQRERYMTEDEKKRARRNRRSRLWQESHAEETNMRYRATTALKVKQAVEAGAVKECSICKVVKPVLDFHAHTTKDGFRSECKDCQKALTREQYQNLHAEARALRQAKSRKYHARNEHLKDIASFGGSSQTSRALGLNNSEFIDLKIELWQEQEGRCAICLTVFDSAGEACLDHDHKTGKARQLLCRNCNFGLGYFGDSIERLKSAIAYLKPHLET